MNTTSTGQTLERIKWGQPIKSDPNQRLADHIICADGFKLSVQASASHYSTDTSARAPYWTDKAPVYPWRDFEVMTYGDRPEPWHCTAWNDGWDDHEDHPNCDGWETYSTGTVGQHGPFSFVPEAVVRALIDLHGGEA